MDKAALWQKARIVKAEATYMIGREFWVLGPPRYGKKGQILTGVDDLRTWEDISEEEAGGFFSILCSLYRSDLDTSIRYIFDQDLELLPEFCTNPRRISLEEFCEITDS